MKEYILDTINRVKRFSESLDVSTLLCNKTWVVFNDTGVKEVFIFQSDGTVLITTNGVGFKTKWNWVNANKSLTIDYYQDTILMLHPEFVDKTILALNLDGTNKYSFLIDENNNKGFDPRTLSELEEYFDKIEQEAIEAENQRLHEKEAAQLNKAIEEKRILEDKILKDKAESIIKKSKDYQYIFLSLVALCFVIIILTSICGVEHTKIIISILLPLGLVFGIIAALIPSIKARKYIKKHPNDPANKFLNEYV